MRGQSGIVQHTWAEGKKFFGVKIEGSWKITAEKKSFPKKIITAKSQLNNVRGDVNFFESRNLARKFLGD